MKFLKRFKQKAKQLKSETQVLIIAYKDQRTAFAAKILIGITIGYLLSPIDLIPDFIPVLGLVDDIIIVPLLIVASVKLIPYNVLNEARETVKNSSAKLKKNNWGFGIATIAIWITIIFFAYKYFKHLWS